MQTIFTPDQLKNKDNKSFIPNSKNVKNIGFIMVKQGFWQKTINLK